MGYLSLYRKYRPQSFGGVFGQEHVTRTLQNAVSAGRVSHAYLFCGPRGTGKTTTARLLAKALNCEAGPAAEPCNDCDSCRQIAGGSSLDVIEIDAASHRGIDPIRELRERVYNATAGGRYRVYIVDEVHMLTNEAFNALLKTLEEPPAHVIFVLATTEAHKIPATIASRCQRFDFRRGAVEHLRQALGEVAEQEKAAIEPAALDLLSRAAAGSWRDALSLLEQVLAYAPERAGVEEVAAVLGTLAPDALDRLVAAALEGDGAALIGEVNAVIAAGKDPRQLLADLAGHMRDLMLTAAGSCPLSPGAEADRLRERARQAGLPRLLRAVELLAEADRELRWSEHPRLRLDLAILRLHRLFTSEAAAPAASATARAAPPKAAPAAAPKPPAKPAPPQREEPPPPEPPPGALLDVPGPAKEDETPPPPEPPPAKPAREPAAAARERPAPPPPASDPWDDVERQIAAPEPPPPAAAPPAAEDGDAGEVRRQWAVVIQELARWKRKDVSGILADVEPERLEDGVLHLRFRYPAQADYFLGKGRGFEEPLEQAILKVCGLSCRLKIVAGEAPAKPAPKPAAAAAPKANPKPKPPPGGRELLHEVVDLFNGQIVDERDSGGRSSE